MIGARKFKNRLRNPDHVPFRIVVIRMLELAVIKICNNLEISISIRYEDMKATQNIENSVVWVDRSHSHWLKILVFHCNYVSILYTVQRHSEILADFNPLHLYLVPPLGVTRLEFLQCLWLRSWAIVPDCLCDDIFNHFDRTETCAGPTDRRTDTRP